MCGESASGNGRISREEANGCQVVDPVLALLISSQFGMVVIEIGSCGVEIVVPSPERAFE